MGNVTIINLNPYKEQPIPEVGKEYHTFDDGKIKPSRHYKAKIVEIIPFKECKDDALKLDWAEDVSACSWLYALETDYFIKAIVDHLDKPWYFVRTVDGGWFSLGYWGSRLDIDGSLYQQMIDNYGEV